MHAQFTTFIVGENCREQVEEAATGLRTVAENQDGFVDITFFYDTRTNEFGTYSFWESKEMADAAGKSLTRAVEDSLGDELKDQVMNRTIEVLET